MQWMVGVAQAVVLVSAAGAAPTGSTSTSAPPPWTLPGVCLPDENGHMHRYPVGGSDSPGESLADELDLPRHIVNGENRLDLVIVGDGYTVADLPQFHADADAIEADFFSYEPFISYRPYFRITVVEVVSNESGVDNDPTQGISRDTALNMGYWCGGTERALCVSTGLARSAAAAGAADVDQVLAIANSSKYGGVGYPSQNVGTAAGQNGASIEVAIHEMGHSLGDLADEYTYGGPTAYTGGERGEINASIQQSFEMVQNSTKWYQWMGYTDARFDSPVGTYEGAVYSATGVFRPSNNSMMRSLARKFNAPSAEQIIKSIYREVSPIDTCTPVQGEVEPDATLSVTLMQPIGHSLEVRWFVNGEEVAGSFGQTTLELGSLGLTGHTEIVAQAVDPTDMVRDQLTRDRFLTQEVVWTVTLPCGPADFNNDGSLNNTDINLFAAAVILGNTEADLNGDGSVNNTDINQFVVAFLAGCGSAE